MKIAFYIIFYIGVFLYTAKTEITMQPFSIKFDDLKSAFGCVLLAGGMTLLVLGTYEKGIKAGAEAMRDEIIKTIDSINNKNKNSE